MFINNINLTEINNYYANTNQIYSRIYKGGKLNPKELQQVKESESAIENNSPLTGYNKELLTALFRTDGISQKDIDSLWRAIGNPGPGEKGYLTEIFTAFNKQQASYYLNNK